jgi:hypothetical protein
MYCHGSGVLVLACAGQVELFACRKSSTGSTYESTWSWMRLPQNLGESAKNHWRNRGTEFLPRSVLDAGLLICGSGGTETNLHPSSGGCVNRRQKRVYGCSGLMLLYFIPSPLRNPCLFIIVFCIMSLLRLAFQNLFCAGWRAWGDIESWCNNSSRPLLSISPSNTRLPKEPKT